MERKTQFGNKVVNESEKQGLVNSVFDKSSAHYDLMNDFMSAGTHRLWKKEAINYLQLQKFHKVCEVAAGSGDLTKLILELVESGNIYMTDININMLNIGYNRLLDESVSANQIKPLLANGEHMPFASNVFDRVICGFGIRNMTSIDRALSEFYRCLSPGGRLVILEFSQVSDQFLNKMYNLYLSKIIPVIGSLVARDRDSYQYLAESIKNHPKQADFAEMMRSAGFVDVAWKNLSFGAVTIHVGIKI